LRSRPPRHACPPQDALQCSRLRTGSKSSACPITRRALPGKEIRRAEGRPVNIIVRASGPSGPAKIQSDDPNHALGLVQYLRTIGYKAWIEDTNGNQIEETVLKNSMK
jgi:hypothetical protein